MSLGVDLHNGNISQMWRRKCYDAVLHLGQTQTPISCKKPNSMYFVGFAFSHYIKLFKKKYFKCTLQVYLTSKNDALNLLK